MEDTPEKKKTKSKKKNDVDINPEIDTSDRTLRIEALTRLGRLKAARSMRRASKSGKLARGKRKMKGRAMTMGRAKKYGWRSARRELKQTLGKKSVSSMTAAEKSRVEKMADKRKDRQKAIARRKVRSLISNSYNPVDKAFTMMLEGKRYHQLLNKDGSVKIDKRFKQYKKQITASVNEVKALHIIADLYENIESDNIDLSILNHLIENQAGSLAEHVLNVSKTLGVDYNELLEKYRDSK